MKPAQFDYVAPTTVDEALEALADLGDEAKILAGGQSLVPTMNFRLARPTAIIDINGVTELDQVVEEPRHLRVGALVRHARMENLQIEDPLRILLAEMAKYIGHLPIRVRGTFGGSLAHADPAAEWCLLAVTLEAEIVARSKGGNRSIPASEFFRGFFVTDLRPTELVVATRIPLLGTDTRFGFAEFSRRDGDFAIVAVLVVLQMDGQTVERANIGLTGVANRPIRIREGEEVLCGKPLSTEVINEAAKTATDNIDEPIGDIHGSAQYRRDLVGALVRRALASAATG